MPERRQRPHTPRIAPLAVILALFIFIFGIISLCTMLPEKAPETLKEPDTQQQDQPQNDPQGTPPAPTGDAITATTRDAQQVWTMLLEHKEETP